MLMAFSFLVTTPAVLPVESVAETLLFFRSHLTLLGEDDADDGDDAAPCEGDNAVAAEVALANTTSSSRPLLWTQRLNSCSLVSSVSNCGREESAIALSPFCSSTVTSKFSGSLDKKPLETQPASMQLRSILMNAVIERTP
jgi:hypothetical protein